MKKHIIDFSLIIVFIAFIAMLVIQLPKAIDVEIEMRAAQSDQARYIESLERHCHQNPSDQECK